MALWDPIVIRSKGWGIKLLQILAIIQSELETTNTRADGYVRVWNAAANAYEFRPLISGGDTYMVRLNAADAPAFIDDKLGGSLRNLDDKIEVDDRIEISSDLFLYQNCV